MPSLSIDCEELLHWWEPKSDVSFIFNFHWRSLQQLREAITIFLSARLHAVCRRATDAIAKTGCPRLKTLMASNPQSPSELLDYLAEVSPAAILVRIAENPNTGSATLSRLAFHVDSEVRSAVADNANTPESCFKLLLRDESPDVRFRIAENPITPVASLYNLLKDENPYVSHRARQTLSRILSNTITMSTGDLTAESKGCADLVQSAQSSQSSQQLSEELKDVCGSEVLPLKFSVPEPSV